MSTTRWQIWGRCRDSQREVWIADLTSHNPNHRNNELTEMSQEYGEHWILWLEAFPWPNPALQVRTPASASEKEMSLAAMKIKHTEREHIYAVAPQ